MRPRAVTIEGASLAGPRAPETLRREGFEGQVTMIGEEPHLPYDRPPLSKQVLAGEWPIESLALTDTGSRCRRHTDTDHLDGVHVLREETCCAAPGVAAAGDVARWHNRRFGEVMRVVPGCGGR